MQSNAPVDSSAAPDPYRSEVADRRLVASVACAFGAADYVGQDEWVQRQADSRCFPDAFIAGVDHRQADRRGSPQAFIAGVELTSLARGDELADYHELSVVRAVRQRLYWPENPLRRLEARSDFLGGPACARRRYRLTP